MELVKNPLPERLSREQLHVLECAIELVGISTKTATVNEVFKHLDAKDGSIFSSPSRTSVSNHLIGLARRDVLEQSTVKDPEARVKRYLFRVLPKAIDVLRWEQRTADEASMRLSRTLVGLGESEA